MASIWRRFLRWWNAEDIAELLRPAHARHCPLCAASRVQPALRTDAERRLIAREWTNHK